MKKAKSICSHSPSTKFQLGTSHMFCKAWYVSSETSMINMLLTRGCIFRSPHFSVLPYISNIQQKCSNSTPREAETTAPTWHEVSGLATNLHTNKCNHACKSRLATTSVLTTLTLSLPTLVRILCGGP